MEKILLTCDNFISREYYNKFETIFGDVCNIKKLREYINNYNEVYMLSIETLEMFYNELSQCDIALLDKNIYIIKNVLITLNILSKVLKVDMKLIWENNDSYFIFRESSSDEQEKEQALNWDIEETEEPNYDWIEKLKTRVTKARFINSNEINNINNIDIVKLIET